MVYTVVSAVFYADNKNISEFFKKISNLVLIFLNECDNILWQSKRTDKTEYALLAQLDRVFGYEPKGQGFESLAARQLRTITTVMVLNF